MIAPTPPPCGVIRGVVLHPAVPTWDDNGDPLTIAAAAADALDWLEWLREYLTQDKSVRWDQARANLARCSDRLKNMLCLETGTAAGRGGDLGKPDTAQAASGADESLGALPSGVPSSITDI